MNFIAFGMILVYTVSISIRISYLGRIPMEILYKKIAMNIKQKIQSGELQADEKIPTENELSSQYGVSRITSKKALNILQEEGLIYRVRGSGSFVKGNTINQSPGNSHATIAIVLPFNHDDTGHGTTLSAIHSISNAFRKRGYYTNLLFSDHNTAKQNACLETLYTKEYVGAIIYPIQTAYNEAIYRLYAKGFPMVMMSNAIDRLDIPAATVDNVRGSYLATKHLIDLGHKKIAFLSSQSAKDNNTISERYLGYLQALHEAHLTSDHALEVIPDHYKKDLLLETLLDMVKSEAVTGIVSVNDETASAFIRHARQCSVYCPESYSIVGFDNLSLCEHTYPPLTTVLQDYGELGKRAADLLIRCIESGEIDREKCVVETRLIQRESTRLL